MERTEPAHAMAGLAIVLLLAAGGAVAAGWMLLGAFLGYWGVWIVVVESLIGVRTFFLGRIAGAAPPARRAQTAGAAALLAGGLAMVVIASAGAYVLADVVLLAGMTVFTGVQLRRHMAARRAHL